MYRLFAGVYQQWSRESRVRDLYLTQMHVHIHQLIGCFQNPEVSKSWFIIHPNIDHEIRSWNSYEGCQKISKACCWFRWATEINEIKMSQGGKVRPMVLHDKGCWLSLIFPGLVVSLFKVGNSKGQSTTDHQLVSYQHYSALNQHWNQLA